MAESRDGAQDALEQQLAVQARIARLAHTLLSLSAEDLDQGIREQLGVAAEIAGVERTRLIVLNMPSRRVAAAYEGRSRAATSGADWVESDVLVGHPWARKQIARGQVVQIPRSEALPSEAADERRHIASYGLRSVLVLPVRSGEAVIGAHIYASLCRERSWSEQEIENLRVVTEIFTSAVRRRQTEAALRESEQRFRAIAEHATELVAEFDLQGRYHYASPSFATRLGQDPSDLVGKFGSLLLHPDDLEASVQSFRDAFAVDTEMRPTHRVRHRDGSWHWFESTGRAYHTANGSPRFVSIGRDVTERKAIEQALLRFFEMEQRVAALSRRFLAVSGQTLDGVIDEALAEAGSLAAADRVMLTCSAALSDERMRCMHEWRAAGIPSRMSIRHPWATDHLSRGLVLHVAGIDDLPEEAQASARHGNLRGSAPCWSFRCVSRASWPARSATSDITMQSAGRTRRSGCWDSSARS